MTAAAKPKNGTGRVLSTLLSLVLPVLAIGVPVLYVLGRVYKESYWLALGVPYSILGYTVEEYVYWGFVAIANGLIRSIASLPFGPFWTWAVTVVVLFLLLFLTFTLRSVIKRLLIWIVAASEKAASALRNSDENWRKQFAFPLLTVGQWINSAYLTFLVSILALSLAILGVNEAGKKQAEKSIEWMRTRAAMPQASSAVAYLNDQSVVQSGAVLECSVEWCVIVRKGRFIAVHTADIERIDGCEASAGARTSDMKCGEAR